jgi:hypothetical protein
MTMDDEAIRAVVGRLARPHRSGGEVIERAAIMAEGPDAGEVIAWVVAHAGAPETRSATPGGSGLHGSRLGFGRDAGSGPPLRYVLPRGALVSPNASGSP